MKVRADCKHLRWTEMGNVKGQIRGERYVRRAYYCQRGRFDTRIRRSSLPMGDLCGKCADYERKKR